MNVAAEASERNISMSLARPSFVMSDGGRGKGGAEEQPLRDEEEKATRRSTEGRRREGRHKRGRLEKECAGGVRAAEMSHLSPL